MDFSSLAMASTLPNQLLLALGVMFFVSSVAVLLLNKRPRDAILNKFPLHRRRASGAKTPPRSISPSSSEKQASLLPANDYVNAFPPSRREALPQVAENASDASKKILRGPEPCKEFLRGQGLPTTRSYDLQNASPKYTPTGFSTEEIKAMGDFPAYDILSGVPLPEPYVGFDVSKALPRPYRPFRWAYHQTMSLTKMEPDWWLEIENTYLARIEERKGLYEKYGNKVLDYLPGSELACKELMEMTLQFCCSRYPHLFTLSSDNSTFHNSLTGLSTALDTTHPLNVLLNNIPEDFALVLRSEHDGLYYFRAGIICSSLGWNVSTKLGLCLADIHAPIPDYAAKMAFSMDRFFSKMPTHAPIQRGSWGLEIGTPLFMPPGDPHERLRESQKPDLREEDCFLRVDWQTLRRLPLSAAVVFNFKALFTPVTEFRDEPFVPALLLKILTEGKKNLMEYKNTWHVEHVCVPLLRAYAKEQREKGWVRGEKEGDEWTVETLQEAPFFPGWEDKWHRQQGF